MQATPNKIEAKLLEIIEKKFPNISLELYEVFDNGWDNQVIILDKQTVFRFPRNEYVKTIHQKEQLLLPLAKQYITLDIPNYTLFTDDNSCVGYEAIEGIPMTTDIYKTLGKGIQDKIESQIALFLTELHSIPLESLAEIGYTPKQGNSDYFRNNFLKTCKNLFTDKELQIVLNYIQELDELDYKHKVITHCDISQKNVFIDNDLTHITGIIDFSDARVSDPALDFGRLIEYGEDFLSAVYEKYQGIKDDEFLERTLFYNKRLAIFVLIDAVEKDTDIEKNMSIFRETFF